MTRTIILAAALAALFRPTAAAGNDADPMTELTALVHEPLAAFAAEPSGSCGSDHLAEAEMMGRSIEAIGYASLSLDVADTAAARGCPAVAREIYRRIIAEYVGSGYGALRQRAEAGLAEVGTGSVLELIDWRHIRDHALEGVIALIVVACAGLIVHGRLVSRRPFPPERLRG